MARDSDERYDQLINIALDKAAETIQNIPPEEDELLIDSIVDRFRGRPTPERNELVSDEITLNPDDLVPIRLETRLVLNLWWVANPPSNLLDFNAFYWLKNGRDAAFERNYRLACVGSYKPDPSLITEWTDGLLRFPFEK